MAGRGRDRVPEVRRGERERRPGPDRPDFGPGVCGAEFPLKVAALGEGSSGFGFADDDLRPPGTIGNQPRWPISQPPPAPPQGAPLSAARLRPRTSGPISLTAPASFRRRARSNCRPRARQVFGNPPVASPIPAPRPIRHATAVRRLIERSNAAPGPPAAEGLPRLGPARAIRSRRSGRSRSSRPQRWPVRSSRCWTAGSPIRCSPPRCAGSAPASSRSSRSPPIPAAA